MSLIITITDAGRAEIVNAQNTGTAPVLITEIGFGTGQYAPAPTQTALQAETKRISTLSGQVVAPDTIHVTVQDASADAYNVGEFGLYTDSGTMFAVFSQAAAAGWIIEKSSVSTLLLATDIIFSNINAASLAFGDAAFLNPPATTTVQGVVELATSAETQAGTDTARAVTPKGLADTYTAANVLEKIKTVDGNGSGLDADLLDGQQGSYYLPAASYNAADVLNKLKTVDGAGSGLDADLLDGLNSSVFQRELGEIPSSGTIDFNTYTSGGTYHKPNNTDSPIYVNGPAGLAVNSRFTLTILKATSDDFLQILSVQDGGSQHKMFKRNHQDLSWFPWVQIWTDATDGAGSGLDADLLDGIDSTGFAISTFPGIVDLNTITKSGMYRLESNQFNQPPNTHYGQMLVIHGGKDTITQMAFDYASADFYIRSGNPPEVGGNGAWTPWYKIWNEGNDGIGSGLDADLLDGQQGSYYLPADSYNAADVLNKIKTVDGSGSGLDADLLEGRHGSYYSPTGAVSMFAMPIPPTGWLKANGAAISRTVYAALFAAIGTTFGAGDGSTTFNLPDLRGEFLRGWDDSRGVDSGRSFGSAQSDAIRNITGSYVALNGTNIGQGATGAFVLSGSANTDSIVGTTTTSSTMNFDASRVVPVAAENRPRNIALLACIKY